MTSQSYVSKELTHFVGRRLHEERRYDEQYELLIRILKDGWLLADPENRNKLYPWPTENAFVLNIESVTEDVYQPVFKPHAVCFCDIPFDHLDIHMSKYGSFGLSFLKSFLIEKRASPVFYCAKNSKVISTLHANRESYFQEQLNRYRRLFPIRNELYDLLEKNMDEDTFQRFMLDAMELYEFLGYYVFGHTKFFDDAAGYEDPNNFYMEREWRVLGNVRFELSNVYRVILPERYAERFHEELPHYPGCLTAV
jgi:Putative abortive phage resistance protein AbiGi, antitoxin